MHTSQKIILATGGILAETLRSLRNTGVSATNTIPQAHSDGISKFSTYCDYNRESTGGTAF
jgi:hypothetical protein